MENYISSETSPWRERLQIAQQIPFPDLAVVSSPSVKGLVSHAAGLAGCSEDALFIPLLTCCAGLMGPKTKIYVHEGWQELPIVWTILATRSGTRKSSILRLLTNALLEIQKDQERQWHLTKPTERDKNESTKETPPGKFLVGMESVNSLCKILQRNVGRLISMHEDVKSLHEHWGIVDGGICAKNRTELLSLYDGAPQFVASIDGDVKVIERTCYNHAGMAHPEYVLYLLEEEPLSLRDRYLIACPRESLSIPCPQTFSLVPKAPSVKAVLQTIHMFHQQFREYVFTGDAWSELCKYRDEEWSSLRIQFDHDDHKRLIIDKSMGQIVRLAGVIMALTNACKYSESARTTGIEQFEWDLKIDSDMARKAVLLMKYFIDQKLALLCCSPLEFGCSFQDYIPDDIPVPEPSVSHVSSAESPVDMSRTPAKVARYGGPPPSDRELAADNTIPGFVNMDMSQFLLTFSNRVRRLLECYDDGNGVTTTTAAQKSIPPPVRVVGTNNRHPTWAAGLFFKKVTELGIGKAFLVKHHYNRKYFLRFKRKRPEELTEDNKRLLASLKVNFDLYCRIGAENSFIDVAESPSTSTMSNEDSIFESESLQLQVKEENIDD